MKTWYIVSFVMFVFFLLACESVPDNDSASDTDSTLQQSIKNRLEEKRELAVFRDKLAKNRLGKSISHYKPIIKKYAKRYGFDWRLITAQIVQESGFRIKARSRVGAHGLMQLMPRTAQEISKELDIEYIMKNPRENIAAGIYHLRKQYRHFPNASTPERTKLALASYNCGAGRVFDAQNIAEYYSRQSNRWDVVNPYLAMLTKTDWELHLQIWPDGKPRYGYFYGYRETTDYVNNIWKLYQVYQKIM